MGVGNVGVVVGAVAAVVHSGRVPLPGLRSLDVRDVHRVPRLDVHQLVLLRLGPFDVVDAHLVPHELRRGHGPHLHRGQVVLGVQRVLRRTTGLELNALGSRTQNVLRLQVVLRLVEADVEIGGTGPVDVPVLVVELGLVHLLRPMKFGGCT